MDAWVALFILLVGTWAFGIAGAVLIYGKFKQHTETAKLLQQGLADVMEELTRPPSKRGRC
jgi:hypothetical protein